MQKPSVELALHADVDGSLEALTESLLALNTGRVIFKVVKASVGAPSTADVQFAQNTGATLVAFGVKVPGAADKLAQTLKVPVLESECARCSTLCELAVTGAAINVLQQNNTRTGMAQAASTCTTKDNHFKSATC